MGTNDSDPLDDLVSFVHGLDFDDVPSDAVAIAEQAFVDTVGVTLAGSREDTVALASTLAGGTNDSGVSIVGREERAPITDASFVNATAGHALDFDDSHGAFALHPSVTMVVPLLAVAEDRQSSGEPVSGADLVTAYVAGFETQCSLGALIAPDHQRRGWHTTGTLGVFGAAAAVARLLELDYDATRHALNVAASMPAGLTRNFGSMTKPMHAGQAARSGVTAALLAAEGFTASRDATFGEQGFLAIYDGGRAPDESAFAVPPGRWSILADGVLFKKYPACGRAQTSIEIAGRLAVEHGIDAADVESIHVVAAESAAVALQYSRPETGREAKFSIEYAVAAAILSDRVGLSTFEDEAVRGSAVQDLLRRVSFEVDDELPYPTRKATVTITTTDGAAFADDLEYPPGHPENPLSSAEVREKFEATASRALDEEAVGLAYEQLDSLHERADLDALFEVC